MVKVKVEKEVSYESADGKKWTKIRYGLEEDAYGLSPDVFPTSKVLEVRGKLLEQIDAWLAEDMGAQKPKSIPQTEPLDLKMLEALEWRQKKNPDGSYILAKKGEWGWIFKTNPKANDLLFAISEADNKLELGLYIYTISGDQLQFINRTPKKKARR